MSEDGINGRAGYIVLTPCLNPLGKATKRKSPNIEIHDIFLKLKLWYRFPIFGPFVPELDCLGTVGLLPKFLSLLDFFFYAKISPHPTTIYAAVTCLC